jgi:hypothetical protein
VIIRVPSFIAATGMLPVSAETLTQVVKFIRLKTYSPAKRCTAAPVVSAGVTTGTCSG